MATDTGTHQALAEILAVERDEGDACPVRCGVGICGVVGAALAESMLGRAVQSLYPHRLVVDGRVVAAEQQSVAGRGKGRLLITLAARRVWQRAHGRGVPAGLGVGAGGVSG